MLFSRLLCCPRSNLGCVKFAIFSALSWRPFEAVFHVLCGEIPCRKRSSTWIIVLFNKRIGKRLQEVHEMWTIRAAMLGFCAKTSFTNPPEQKLRKCIAKSARKGNNKAIGAIITHQQAVAKSHHDFSPSPLFSTSFSTPALGTLLRKAPWHHNFQTNYC